MFLYSCFAGHVVTAPMGGTLFALFLGIEYGKQIFAKPVHRVFENRGCILIAYGCFLTGFQRCILPSFWQRFRNRGQTPPQRVETKRKPGWDD